ncbi:MAG: TIGR02449 family protein [Coxiellaceae bacterium]|nr:TIGR02449 family protein [Coxiellaceae bacterium]
MDTSVKESFSNIDMLTHLELQIEGLMNAREKLSQENNSLRHKLTKVTQERARLYDKTERAAARIKRLIAQLKDDMNE